MISPERAQTLRALYQQAKDIVEILDEMERLQNVIIQKDIAIRHGRSLEEIYLEKIDAQKKLLEEILSYLQFSTGLEILTERIKEALNDSTHP